MSESKIFSKIAQKEKRGIFYLQLHITPDCNLRCKHCYEDYSNLKESCSLLSPVEIYEIIEQYEEFLNYLKMYGKIYFTGGEPILDSNLLKYIEKASKLKMCTMILTNGTLINLQKAHDLKKAGTKIVQISLEGIKENHDYIRGNGTFKKATKGLDNCNKVGISTTVMMTLSRLNIDEVEDVIRHCIKHKVNRIAFSRLVPIGNGSDFLHDVLTKQELLKFFKKLKRWKHKYKEFISISFHDPLWLTFCKEKGFHGCSAGISGICIIENGDIMPCRRLDLPIGNIRINTLFEIWNSIYLKHFRERDCFQGKCRTCKYLKKCGGCRAVSRAIYGSEFSEDPQCFL